MPNRILREGILDSERVNALSFPAEVFYRRLMSIVDDFGRFDARISILRGRLYALKLDTVREADITRWITECEKASLIVLYQCNSKPYLSLSNFGEPRAKDSKYPPPPTDASGREHMNADANICEQTQTSVPYSYSSSDTYSNTGSMAKPAAKFDHTTFPLPTHFQTDQFRAIWNEFGQHRANKKKPLTELATKNTLKQLEPYSHGEAIDLIRAAIANDWTGVVFKETKPPAPKPHYDKVPGVNC